MNGEVDGEGDLGTERKGGRLLKGGRSGDAVGVGS